MFREAKKLKNLLYLCFILFLFLSVEAYSTPVPALSFLKDGDKMLIFINNPDQLTLADLADNNFGKKSIYQDKLGGGKYRVYFEHCNETGSVAGYTIKLYNPENKPVSIKLFGSGFEASMYGGKPLSKMMASYK